MTPALEAREVAVARVAIRLADRIRSRPARNSAPVWIVSGLLLEMKLSKRKSRRIVGIETALASQNQLNSKPSLGSATCWTKVAQDAGIGR